jgi:hypothetical protein
LLDSKLKKKKQQMNINLLAPNLFNGKSSRCIHIPSTQAVSILGLFGHILGLFWHYTRSLLTQTCRWCIHIPGSQAASILIAGHEHNFTLHEYDFNLNTPDLSYARSLFTHTILYTPILSQTRSLWTHTRSLLTHARSLLTHTRSLLTL